MSSVLSHLLPRMSGRLVAGGLLAASLAAIVGACSATLDFTECLDDNDCAKFFEDNQPMFCDGNVCKVRDGGCDSNSQCAGLGAQFICTNSATTRVCEATDVDGCEAPIYPGGEMADDVVFTGLMLPKTGADKVLGADMEKAALAAFADFNKSGALQSGDKVATVVCDTKSDPTAAVAAAKHLGDRLTVPVFIGPVDDLEFTRVVDEVTFAPRVNAFTMGPMVTAALDGLDTGDLVFSAMPGAKFQGAALGRRIGGEYGGNMNANLLLVFSFDAYGEALYDATATMSTGAGKPKRIPDLPGAQAVKSFTSVDEASSFLEDNVGGSWGVPNVLVLFGRSEVAEILKRYKAAGFAWPERIFVSQRSMAAVAALADASLAGVVVAIAPDLETAKLAALRTRIGQPSLSAEAALAYDATMSSLLAMAAVKAGGPVVGLPVAKAVTKLADKTGVAVDFGEAPSKFVPAAVEAFKAGKGVDIAGITGALDFDAEGEVCGPIGAFTLDATGGKWTKVATYTPACPDTAGTWADVP